MPAPLLKSIDYTDAYDVSSTLYQYDEKGHLLKLQSVYKTPTDSGKYYHRYAWSGSQVLAKEFDKMDVELPASATTYTLNSQGYTASRVYQAFDNNLNKYVEYKNLFEYGSDNYLKKISNYYVPDNSLTYVFEYQYNSNHELDSISGYLNAGNNNLQKYVVWIFQYEEGKKNTIGNSAMSGSIDDALNLSGKGQPYALKKEQLFVYNSTKKKWTLNTEDTYTNQYDAKGLQASRSLKSLYYFADGSAADSVTATYVYTYQ